MAQLVCIVKWNRGGARLRFKIWFSKSSERFWTPIPEFMNRTQLDPLVEEFNAVLLNTATNHIIVDDQAGVEQKVITCSHHLTLAHFCRSELTAAFMSSAHAQLIETFWYKTEVSQNPKALTIYHGAGYSFPGAQKLTYLVGPSGQGNPMRGRIPKGAVLHNSPEKHQRILSMIEDMDNLLQNI